MKLILLFAIMSLMGCRKPSALLREEEAILSIKPERVKEEAPIFAIESSLTARALKEALLLLPYSEEKLIKNPSLNDRLEYSLTRDKSTESYRLKPKKSLIGGRYYAFYVLNNNEYHFLYKIYVEREAARIVATTLEKTSLPNVAKNRIYFSFVFNQEIWLSDDDAVELKSREGDSVEIELMTLRLSKKHLEVHIKAGQLEESKTYYFQFNNIVNLDKRVSVIDPLQFIVGREEISLEENRAPQVMIANNGIEISWHLNQAHTSELYFGDNEAGLDCLGQLCPMELGMNKTKKSFLSKSFIGKLKPMTTYHIVLRAEDYQGNILLRKASIQTEAPSSLGLSEILLNPSVKPEAKGEYIEYRNIGKEELYLGDIFLHLDNNRSSHQCQIIAAGEEVAIAPKSYIRIVGKDYDEKSNPVNAHTTLVRAKQKSLCGGLHNKIPTVIKLVRGQSHILDYYAGHLWPAKVDQNIKKRDPEGLDEAKNYCYSTKAKPSC